MTVKLTKLSCPKCGAALKGEPSDLLFTCPSCGSGAAIEEEGLQPVECVALLPARDRKADLWKPGWLIEASVEIAARETNVERSGLSLEGKAGSSPIPRAMLEEIVRRMGVPGGVIGGLLGAAAPASQPAEEKVRVEPERPRPEGPPLAGGGGVGPIADGGGDRPRARSGVRSFIIPAFDLPLDALAGLARAYARAHADLGDPPRQSLTGGTLSLADARTLVVHLVIGEEVGKPDMLASVDVTLRPARHRLIALPFERAGSALRCAVTGLEIPD